MVNPDDISHRVVRLLLERQRRARTPGGCAAPPCPACSAAHTGAVRSFVEAGEPVVFVLPGFPCKSPNPAKVLGPLPDMAERLALEFLDDLCRRVAEFHEPGARVVICSDGRVFSDLVHVPDDRVTAYQNEIRAMIARHHPGTLSLFGIDDLDGMHAVSHDAMRRALEEAYGEPGETIRREVREGGEALRLYRAITRFLFEDGLTPDYTGSRSALQRDARRRAYGVILRSRAWGRLVADRLPGAVRLSIHPQGCGSPKLGVKLTADEEDWLTPWHGVAVDLGGRFVLRGRAEAERLGARLVLHGGRPSHYVHLPQGAGEPAGSAPERPRRPSDRPAQEPPSPARPAPHRRPLAVEGA